MVLRDKEITTLINTAGLVLSSKKENVVNCAYTLRAGRFIEPESGKEVIHDEIVSGRRNHGCEIGQSEVMIVMTKEHVKMPSNLCAIYAPLFRLSQKGLMLINASLVEPGYEGPLSCFLINTGSKPVTIRPEEEISKIMFLKLDCSPDQLKKKKNSEKDYLHLLSDSARNFQRSFLNITGIEDQAAKKAKEEVTTSIRIAGFILAVLVVFGTLEPLFSKMFFDKTGIASITQRTDDALRLKDLQRTRDELKDLVHRAEVLASSNDSGMTILKLQADLDRIKKKEAQSASQQGSQSSPPTLIKPTPTPPRS